MPTRGWTMMTEHEESDIKARVRAEMIGKLAAEWNEIHARVERHSFRSDEDIEAEEDYLSERLDEEIDGALEAAEKQKGAPLTKEERLEVNDRVANEIKAAMNSKTDEDMVRLDAVEELLGDLGARMMRPYEHWGEQERYVEYMENRYDYDEMR